MFYHALLCSRPSHVAVSLKTRAGKSGKRWELFGEQIVGNFLREREMKVKALDYLLGESGGKSKTLRARVVLFSFLWKIGRQMKV